MLHVFGLLVSVAEVYITATYIDILYDCTLSCLVRLFHLLLALYFVNVCAELSIYVFAGL